MYLPRAFAETDPAQLDALFARVQDGQVADDGRAVGDRIVLRGHWAKPNPQATHTGPALVIAHGPHAYVSPSCRANTNRASARPGSTTTRATTCVRNCAASSASVSRASVSRSRRS